MRWTPFAVLLVIALALQTAACPRLALAGSRPDVVLVLVLLYACFAPYSAAVTVGVAAGLAVGLSTVEPAALFAAPYAAAALAVYAVRDLLFVRHIVTQGILAVGAGALCQSVWWTYHAWVYPAAGGGWPSLGRAAGSVAYTAALTPLLCGAMLRGSRLLGFPVARYSFRGSRRGGSADV